MELVLFVILTKTRNGGLQKVKIDFFPFLRVLFLIIVYEEFNFVIFIQDHIQTTISFFGTVFDYSRQMR